MKTFHSGREAKEFLISRIVSEAQRENVLLSDVERKMLYFTESGWTLPEMDVVSADFDRDYDQNECEQKIARLIRKAAKHDRKKSREEYDAWWSAIRFLKGGDHYISVMIGIAGLRPAGDQLRLFGTALAIVTWLLLGTLLSVRYQLHLSKYVPSQDAFAFYIWSLGAGCRHRLPSSPIHHRREQN
jgi:hypothetical protein